MPGFSETPDGPTAGRKAKIGDVVGAVGVVLPQRDAEDPGFAVEKQRALRVLPQSTDTHLKTAAQFVFSDAIGGATSQLLQRLSFECPGFGGNSLDGRE